MMDVPLPKCPHRAFSTTHIFLTENEKAWLWLFSRGVQEMRCKVGAGDVNVLACVSWHGMTWPWFKLLHPEKEWSSANDIHHAQKYPSPRPLSPQLHVPSPSADLARGLQWLSEPHLFCDASRRQDCWMLRGSYAKLVAVAVARIVLEPLMKSNFMLEPCPQNTVCGVHAEVPMFAPITLFFKGLFFRKITSALKLLSLGQKESNLPESLINNNKYTCHLHVV